MSLDQSLSDEDIFWGPMTFKEVKRRLFGQAREIPCTISATTNPKEDENENIDTSIKIFQYHSEPNLIIKHKNNSENITEDNNLAEDDSFVQLENMVEKLCLSPALADLKQTQELNNTLDVIEYILNNPPKNEGNTEAVTDMRQANVENFDDNYSEVTKESPGKKIPLEKKNAPEQPTNTPVKNENIVIKKVAHNTPQNAKPKPVFKTPAQSKKPFTPSLMRTPSNTNAFQHIVSPVASYIKNTPNVALVKDSHQKKNMAVSLIPKLRNNLPVKSSNKENNNFTSGAYKSAKKIKVIDTEEQRLPHRHGVKTSTLPKPLVQTHNHRVVNRLQKHSLQQEDSVADLSIHQAELSVYLQKYASKTDK